ncbi:unnamed protein product [Brachionus calyciflorus]|uniref:Uncharacterized protein n=1 Tax=Brachionus calyciflorus TaxID=104777 RepID=A0A814CBP7_9BILA|nr:unnamed protein product [Brachionus calyciflorus]
MNDTFDLVSDITLYGDDFDLIWYKQILQLIQELIAPLLSFLGLFLRVICILIYLKPVKNSYNRILKTSYESINKALLFNSISQALLCLITIFLPVFYCMSRCINSSYFSHFYYKYMTIYGTATVEMITILANIVMCLNRYLIIFKYKTTFNLIKFRYICLLTILISSIVNLPYLYMVIIDYENDGYYLVPSNFSRSRIGIFFKNFIPVIRYIVLAVIFIVVNTLLLYHSIKYAKNRERVLLNQKNLNQKILVNMSKNSRTEKEPNDLIKSNNENLYKLDSSEWNLTRMSLFICLIYVIKVIFITVTFLNSKLNVINYSLVVALELVSAIMVQLTNLLEILSYFLFNLKVGIFVILYIRPSYQVFDNSIKNSIQRKIIFKSQNQDQNRRQHNRIIGQIF